MNWSKTLLSLVTLMFSQHLYGKTVEQHKVLTCNQNMSVCVENGVVKEKNTLTKDDKTIYTKVCIYNRIQDEEVYRCEVKAGLPKYEPKAATAAPKTAPVMTPAPVKKNSVIIHAGVGPTGLKFHQDEDGIAISQKVGPTGGFSYLRRVGDRFELTGTFLLNRTGLMGVGVDF